MTARVVVAIPSFNASATIAETLDALQHCDGLDRVGLVIVQDDGSTDDTALRARAAWRRDMPELIIRELESNVGQNNNVNQLIDYAGQFSDWVLILHADDVVNSNWLTLTIGAIDNAGELVASVCSSYDCWFSDTGEIVTGENYPGRPHVVVRGGQRGVVRTLSQGCWWHISGCAIRVTHFKKVGDFRPDLDLGDYEWLLRCQSLGLSIEYIPRTTMRYRMHRNSISSASNLAGRDILEKVKIFHEYERQNVIDRKMRRRMQRDLMMSLLRRAAGHVIRRRPLHIGALLRAFRAVVLFR